MGRDHTLYALVQGEVKYTRERRNKPQIKGQKYPKPWKRFVHIMREPQVQPVVLKELLS